MAAGEGPGAEAGTRASLPRQHRPGVNFINILHLPFWYKSVLRSFSLVTVWLCNFFVQEYWYKSENVDEIDYSESVEMMTKHSWTDGDDLPTTRLSIDLRRGDIENNGGVTRLAKKS